MRSRPIPASPTRRSSTSSRPISAAAPAIRTLSRPCAARRPNCAARNSRRHSMSVGSKTDSGTRWVGRSIRRVEDPALVRGHGRFTGDLTARLWVRFVRSPVAAGKITHIAAPEGATVFTAADLAAVKPIAPLLHKFGYVPVRQPVLAQDVVRFVGEPVAAVVAPTSEAAEDLADRIAVEIEES